MARIKTVFFGTDRSETNQDELQCYANANDEIFISIDGDSFSFVCLDVETAIQLSKELKKAIGVIKQNQKNV